MKQKLLFWGAAVALTFLFSASAVAQPRHTKKKVKKVVEAKVDVCPFTDKWVEDETKFEDRKEKAHATFVPFLLLLPCSRTTTTNSHGSHLNVPTICCSTVSGNSTILPTGSRANLRRMTSGQTTPMFLHGRNSRCP